MKVKIDSDEWYPVYSIIEDNSHYEYEIELTEEEVRLIKSAHEAIAKAQSIIIDKIYPE